MKKKITHKNPELKLHDAEVLLKKIDVQSIDIASENFGDNWEDNLFEIVMARLDLIEENSETMHAITEMIKKQPIKSSGLLKTHISTMHNILLASGAPNSPLTVLAFSVLYFQVIDAYFNDGIDTAMAKLSQTIERLKQINFSAEG